MSYEDIMHLTRPKSMRKKMSMASRASQFAPFAALNGHEKAINETHRLTSQDQLLSIDQKAELDYILSSLRENKSLVCVHYFIKDERKAGGSMQTYEGVFKKIDENKRLLVFVDGRKIALDDIRAISEVA